MLSGPMVHYCRIGSTTILMTVSAPAPASKPRSGCRMYARIAGVMMTTERPTRVSIISEQFILFEEKMATENEVDLI
jgi:hypothetical protein